MADITQYLDLITSQHRSKPKFAATVAATVQPLADIAETLAGFPAAFDLDAAVGDQLDAVGLWIGQGRNIEVALDVYFALDDADHGLDTGWLKGRYDPDTGLQSLDDDQYRTLLRAKIAVNHWDGSIPSAYRLLGMVFPDHIPVVQDYGDMSMLMGLVGPSLDSVEMALFTGGHLSVKPAGVRIIDYAISNGPFFGLDGDSATVAGLDEGYLI
jgi:hypothetical protein